jgi:hypothetical protein
MYTHKGKRSLETAKLFTATSYSGAVRSCVFMKRFPPHHVSLKLLGPHVQCIHLYSAPVICHSVYTKVVNRVWIICGVHVIRTSASDVSIVTELLKAFLGNGSVNTFQRATVEDVPQWTNVIARCKAKVSTPMNSLLRITCHVFLCCPCGAYKRKTCCSLD